jgi:hypothetical protein
VVNKQPLKSSTARWDSWAITAGFVLSLFILLVLAVAWPFVLAFVPSEADGLSVNIWGWLLLINFLVFLAAIFIRRLKIVASWTLLLSIIGFATLQAI